MKHIIILGDGMADHAVERLGGKTLMQYADTPYMDMLARKGRTGRLNTIPDGFHPGSEVANTAILGYNLNKVYEGRGPLEAASIGYEMEPGDMAIRCNIVCIESGKIKNHHAGHLTTEEGNVLIKYLQEQLGNERVRFITGIQYRHLLVIKGGNKHIECTPPHDVPDHDFLPLMVKPETGYVETDKGRMTPLETTDLINDLIIKSQKLLSEHPFNIEKAKMGIDQANSIWPWSPGYRPQMDTLSMTFPQIKSGSVISAVDLIRGIGYYAGLRKIVVPGATGLYDTNYEGKAEAAIEALKTDDFVFLHLEASDEAGHDGDIDLKIKTIEYLDHRIVEPVYNATKNWEYGAVSIAILPDHPTPCEIRTHTKEPIPFLIYYPGITPDDVELFDEIACVSGSYGMLKGDEFMNEFMKY